MRFPYFCNRAGSLTRRPLCETMVGRRGKHVYFLISILLISSVQAIASASGMKHCPGECIRNQVRVSILGQGQGSTWPGYAISPNRILATYADTIAFGDQKGTLVQGDPEFHLAVWEFKLLDFPVQPVAFAGEVKKGEALHAYNALGGIRHYAVKQISNRYLEVAPSLRREDVGLVFFDADDRLVGAVGSRREGAVDRFVVIATSLLEDFFR